MNSYWEESINRKEYPKLGGNIETEICIVGARNIWCNNSISFK